MKPILTIAGHDPSNGAGITKDLEVFSLFGLHGLSVPTSFVVQGPQGVAGFHPVVLEAFSEMLEQVGKDFSLAAIKVGVLADEDHVRALTLFLQKHRDVPVVLDPVMKAKNGTELLSAKALKSLIKQVLPLVTCLTPNMDEAEALLKKKITTVDDMGKAARALTALGPKTVLLKGGHLSGNPVDIFFDGDTTTTHKRTRMDRVLHGAGCILSSSFASCIALGYAPKTAFRESETLMATVLGKSNQPVEKGYHYAFPAMPGALDPEHWDTPRISQNRSSRTRHISAQELERQREAVGSALRAARGIDGDARRR